MDSKVESVVTDKALTTAEQQSEYKAQLNALIESSQTQGANLIALTGCVPFTRSVFSADYEKFARQITNPNGGHNSGEPMLPQDKLSKVWGWFHGKTGFSAMFLWASGRQDAYVILDNHEASLEAIKAQQTVIEQYTKENANVTVH